MPEATRLWLFSVVLGKKWEALGGAFGCCQLWPARAFSACCLQSLLGTAQPLQEPSQGPFKAIPLLQSHPHSTSEREAS